MKKRYKQCLIFVLLLTLILSGCSLKTDEPETEHTQLAIAFGEYAPFCYTDGSGAIAGVDVDIAREACRRMGIEANFYQIDWQERDTLLESGQVDCLWACYSMNGREDQYLWAGPYIYSPQVVAVSEDSDIHSLADLAGLRIAVQMGSKPEEMFLERSDARIPEVEHVFCLADINEMVSALRREYVQACAGHRAALTQVLDSVGMRYRVLDEPLLYASIGVAFRLSDDRGYCEALQTAFEEMRADGTLYEILRCYGLDKGYLSGEDAA